MSKHWTIHYIPARLWIRLRHGIRMPWRDVFALRVDVPPRTKADVEHMRQMVLKELAIRELLNPTPKSDIVQETQAKEQA